MSTKPVKLKSQMFIKPEDLDLLEDSCNELELPSVWTPPGELGQTLQNCLFPKISKGAKIPTSTFRALAPGITYAILRRASPGWGRPNDIIKGLNYTETHVPVFVDKITGESFLVGNDEEVAETYTAQKAYAAQKGLNYAKYKTVSNCSAASISSRLSELENEEKGEGEGGKGGTI